MRLVGGRKEKERKHSRRMSDGLVDECKAVISVTEHVVTRSGDAKRQEL